MAGRIVIGTSSWADPGFIAEWYPPGLPARERLAWYAQRFEGVEVNATAYAIPAPDTVERWAEETPQTFTFDVKLHRLLSRHAVEPESLPTDMRDGIELTTRGRVVLSAELEAAVARRTLDALDPLVRCGKLSTLLLQLSPAFKPRSHSLDELSAVLEAVAPHPVAIEFRHRGWVDERRLPDTLGWLESHAAIFVGVDAPQGKSPTMMPPVDAVTHPRFAYLRAHGRNADGYLRGRTVAERFAWKYSDDELREIGDRARRLAEDVPFVRVMLNNNRGADAPHSARRLRELLGQVPPGGEEGEQLALPDAAEAKRARA
jgi:uncharacterized protein YecE (DUF72 family)